MSGRSVFAKNFGGLPGAILGLLRDFPYPLGSASLQVGSLKSGHAPNVGRTLGAGQATMPAVTASTTEVINTSYDHVARRIIGTLRRHEIRCRTA